MLSARGYPADYLARLWYWWRNRKKERAWKRKWAEYFRAGGTIK